MKKFRPGRCFKLLFYMKLCFLLITSFCLNATAKGYSQTDVRISLNMKEATVNKVLTAIERKSGFRILYSEADFAQSDFLSVHIKDGLLTELLGGILKERNLKYKLIDNKVIVISPSDKADAVISVSGKVTDSKGSPMANVSVKVKETDMGTITDATGSFDLRFPDDVSSVLIFSYVGYETKEIKVKNNQKLSITLEPAVGGLNEIVVVGYGKQKRNSVTAAVSSIKGDVLAKASVANISNTLGGRVAGVISRQSSGEPGDDNDQIQIRGIGTTGNSKPLVVVNGIPMDYNQLNPNEVETVTILKDAAAVAPYGLAGANGVILVTTRRGKEGKFAMNYDGFYGIQQPTNMPEFLNAYDYARVLSLANQNVGNAPTYTPEQLQKFKDGSDPDHYPNTDWVNEILSPSSPMTRHSLSFSGGSQKVKFFSNLGYLFQEGVVTPINFRRYNLTVNVDAEVTNSTTVSFDINGAMTKRTKPSGQSGSSIFTNVTEIPPILPLRYSNGKPAHSLLPLIYESGYNNENNNVVNAKIQIEQRVPFIKGLSFKAAFAYNNTDTMGKIWTTPATFYSLSAQNEYLPQAGGVPSPTLSQKLKKTQNLVLQGYITYDRTYGKHSINALGVFEGQNGLFNTFSSSRINYAVMLDELSSGSSNKNDFDNSGSSGENAQVGWVYQVNYGYASKYLLGLSGRYNGHYYFAPGKRFAFFPAASVGWVLSEEDFMKNKLTWVDNLKLRGSYGLSGNLAGEAFQYLTSYGLRSSYVFGGTAATQVQGIYENAQSNPDITWETARKANIGVDGLLFKGKLGFTIDVFKERRSDMLIVPSASVPAEYGIGISQINAGIMENRGIEFSLTANHKFMSGIQLNAEANFSYAKNKLVQTFENASTYNNPNRRTTGRAYNAQFGLQSPGLYQLSDFEANGTTLKAGLPVPTFGAVKPGDIKYLDLAGAPDVSGKPGGPDGKIDVNDYTQIGEPLFPQIIYGFNIGASWKGIDINTLWQGAGKASIYLSGETAVPFFNGAKIFKEQTDYWTPENPNASYPRLTPTPLTNNTQPSSFWIRNGNYLRLKTLEVGYSLPARVMNAIRLKSIRIFASGQNLLTFSQLKFLDPELGNERARYYFQQRVISFGTNIGF